MSAPETPPKSWDDVQGVAHLTATANALAEEIRERDALAARVERLAQMVFDRIGERIDAQPRDGISAGGAFSETVQDHQRQFVDGMRLARLLAVNTIRAALSTQEG